MTAHCPRRICVALLILLLSLPGPLARGQLAITEVMTSAATSHGAAVVTQHSDFWELTNFGTNTIALDEFMFADDRGVAILDSNRYLFAGKHIDPDESIIIFKQVGGVVETAEDFRAWWWGDTNLLPNLQIIPYTTPGLGSDNEVVQLFRVTATSTTLVDRVEVFAARPGFTFTYDPATALFGVFSVAGQNGAFQAVTTDDVGSPGFTTGPVPLSITMQPQDLIADAGTPATFSVQAAGVPRPRFQWHKSGVPIPGETSSTLTIFPALPANEGDYSVQLENGLTNVVSASATLVVNTNPECARIVVPPADVAATYDPAFEETAIFNAVVRGFPLPAIQWKFNGTNIPDATNATLAVPISDFNAAGSYTIVITNLLCTNSATAHLTVTRKPLLLVTEAMAQTSTNTLKSGHSDWWELTNRDTNAVNLRGYKFSDLPGPSLEPGSPFVIKNDVIIQPGESIIFVRNMSREAFMDWWGEENLPADLQIITYTGHNFQPQRDGAYLYGPAATDPLDYVCGVNFDFCDPTDPTDPNCVILAGVSKWFDPVEAQYGEFSVLGERGAIRAVEADDVGSPGWTANHPPREYSPRFTSLVRNSAGATLTWEARPNKRYELQYKNALTETNWTPLSQRSATGLALTVLDPSATNAARRFYRLQLLP